MANIKFQYQVKKPIHLFDRDTRERYEVRELIHICDPNKSDRENIDDAFSIQRLVNLVQTQTNK